MISSIENPALWALMGYSDESLQKNASKKDVSDAFHMLKNNPYHPVGYLIGRIRVVSPGKYWEGEREAFPDSKELFRFTTQSEGEKSGKVPIRPFLLNPDLLIKVEGCRFFLHSCVLGKTSKRICTEVKRVIDLSREKFASRCNFELLCRYWYLGSDQAQEIGSSMPIRDILLATHYFKDLPLLDIGIKAFAKKSPHSLGKLLVGLFLYGDDESLSLTTPTIFHEGMKNLRDFYNTNLELLLGRMREVCPHLGQSDTALAEEGDDKAPPLLLPEPDVLIRVSGRHFSLHSQVLRKHCEIIKGGLDFGNIHHLVDLDLLGFSDISTVSLLAKYWHQDEVVITPSNIVKVLLTADFFQDVKLRKSCIDWIVNSSSLMNAQNYKAVFRLALFIHSRHLKEYVVKELVAGNVRYAVPFAERFKNAVSFVLDHGVLIEDFDATNIYFYDTQNRKIFFDFLSKLAADLKDLRLGDVSKSDLESVGKLVRLKKLNLKGGTDLEPGSLEQIVPLQELEDLEISKFENISDQDLRAIASLSNLNRLFVTISSGVSAEGLLELNKLTKLTHFELNIYPEVGSSIFGSLGKLDHLTHLNLIGWFRLLPNSFLGLPALPNLKMLNLTNTFRIDDECLDHIAHQAPNLEILNLTLCYQFSMVGLNSLLTMKQLSHLNLSRCMQLKPADIQVVARISTLEQLDLSGCSVNAEHLSALREMENLQTLVLENIFTLNIEKLRPLVECHPLLTLNLKGCKQVTEEDCLELKRMRPDWMILRD